MIINTIILGLIFSILGFGIFISFKILNYTDLTSEAAFTIGAAVCVMLTTNKLPVIAIFLSPVAGALCGMITGILHTKLRVDKVLSGIITLTGLYTIILLITKMDPNIGLKKGTNTIFCDNDIINLIIIIAVVAIVFAGILIFFSTKLGLSLRGCGDNENMIMTNGLNTDFLKIFGLALSNGLIALSGALFMQYERYYDSSFGNGMMVVGVTVIIVGEVIIKTKHKISLMLIAIILGSLLYRFLYLLILNTTNEPVYMKLLSALSIVLCIIYTLVKEKIINARNKKIKCSVQ